MCEIMLDREFTRYSRGKGRTHHYSGTHTKSSTIAIKSKAISLLLAIHTQSALTHAPVHTHTQTDKFHYPMHCITIRLL